MNASDIFNYYSVISEHIWAQILITVSIYILATILFELFISKVVRKLSANTTTHIDDYIIDVLHNPIYQTVVLIGIVHIVLLAEFRPLITDNVIKLAKSFIMVSWLTSLIKITNFLGKTQATWRDKLGRCQFD